MITIELTEDEAKSAASMISTGLGEMYGAAPAHVLKQAEAVHNRLLAMIYPTPCSQWPECGHKDEHDV